MEGDSNYKIACRIEGVPHPQVYWYKDGVVLDDSHRGIAIKQRRLVYGNKYITKTKLLGMTILK